MEKNTTTQHQFILEDAREMSDVPDGCIHLVVTSPPYPMIEIWDDLFRNANAQIADALNRSDADRAFELMHQELDPVWRELLRVLVPGGIACINVGDATRSIQGAFRLFANHARIINAFQGLGLYQLPTILWRKTTNAPNKFMGSGMMPPGAYVTLEHEYILIFRKGGKREFSDEHQKQLRRQSAYFWEERNNWFSDVWLGLPGTHQNLGSAETRRRTAAFPLEIAYRLINMFSIKGDTVLDPFLGSGTTMIAAMSAGRNSLGYEMDDKFQQVVLERIASVPDIAQGLIDERLAAHHEFLRERMASRGDLKYVNHYYGFAVMTRQEQDLCFDRVESTQYQSGNLFTVGYINPASAGQEDHPLRMAPTPAAENIKRPSKGRQLKLF